MTSGSLRHPLPGASQGIRAASGLAARLRARPELLGLLSLAGILNLYGLGTNGWANTYYSAAVRSMSTSWHDFLFASLDKAGLMTVDKPPLALWVQSLSVRVFGFHPLSILVPEALMGIAAVGLVYDLVARRFGRVAGFAAGLALATTPVTVAVARHNNPDELLVLCCVAAVWAVARGLENGRTRWLVASGVLIGLGFETKMGVALLVVPGIAAAWMWSARGTLWARIRQLLAGGAAMLAVGGAWPLLVWLTPSSDRPWISGTSDNSVWSLIFGYNGLGRVAGQSGGPAGGGVGGGFGGTMFGGPTGLFRLLQNGLGDQAGWLLGFSLVALVALVVLTRLRRGDPRTGWLIAVGGALLVPAVVFSFAGGIFHPYYVSFLAPFGAAFVGAGAALMLDRAPSARVIAPLAIAGAAVTELVVLGQTGGRLGWAIPVIVLIGGATAVALGIGRPRRLPRVVLVAAALAALLAAPASWAAETLGHATSSTFPTGGPASASAGAPGGPGAGSRLAGGPPAAGFAGPPPGSGAPRFAGPPPGGTGGGAPGSFGGGSAGAFGGGSASISSAISYASSHGGGTIAVESQSTAASAILSDGASVAGLGGFSGRESSVSISWPAGEVRAGRLRWVIAESAAGPRLAGDTRAGSQDAFAAVRRACRAVSVSTGSSSVTMYDCLGRADAIASAGGR